jgi:hypothetical protein
VNRQPFIVGATADKVVGFFAGLFGSVMGVIAAIVVMFLWAGSGPGPDVDDRRHHATSVSIWSAVGCALPVIVVILVLVLGVVVFTTSTTIHGPIVQVTPVPIQPSCTIGTNLPCPIP